LNSQEKYVIDNHLKASIFPYIYFLLITETVLILPLNSDYPSNVIGFTF
jgi:hypothetical protein